mmetsp:Transcript_36842/g.86175  ORF Transcript_36842/g.86175 Transcript_36842/m.86175 type:complete len:259 (-) Transcript_36842:593-1369(-)
MSLLATETRAEFRDEGRDCLVVFVHRVLDAAFALLARRGPRPLAERADTGGGVRARVVHVDHHLAVPPRRGGLRGRAHHLGRGLGVGVLGRHAKHHRAVLLLDIDREGIAEHGELLLQSQPARHAVLHLREKGGERALLVGHGIAEQRRVLEIRNVHVVGREVRGLERLHIIPVVVCEDESVARGRRRGVAHPLRVGQDVHLDLGGGLRHGDGNDVGERAERRVRRAVPSRHPPVLRLAEVGPRPRLRGLDLLVFGAH